MVKLRKKIIKPVFFISILGFLIFILMGFYASKNTISYNIETIAKEKVEKLSRITDEKLKRWRMQIELLAESTYVEKENLEGLRKYILQKGDSFYEFDDILILTPKGDYKSLKFKDEEEAKESIEKAPINTSFKVSDPFFYGKKNLPVVMVSVPITREGVYKGKVIGIISLHKVTDEINEETMGEDGYAYMVNSSGYIIAHPRKSWILKKNILKIEEVKNISKNLVERKKGVEEYSFEGKKRIAAYGPIQESSWTIGVSIDFKEVLSNVSDFGNSLIVIQMALMVLILSIMYILIDKETKPLNRLKEYMEIAIQGNLNIKSDIYTNDEIEMLSETFNKLISENRKLIEETREYDKLRTEFFSNISHELRTPLNIIFSTIQLIEKNDSLVLNNQNKSVKFIKIIKQNCYRQLRLINNLIDINKIDFGYLNLKLQNVDIVQLIESITLSTVDYVQSKNRKIIFDTNIEEKIISVDIEKIERIMLNLISNAIKFTKEEDRIVVSVLDQSDSIQISVKDTGIGIPEDKLELIFDRFRQVEDLYRRHQEGSGIGLYLVKSLVEMHSGSIKVKSYMDMGSEFIINIPSNNKNEGPIVNLLELDGLIEKEKIKIEFSDI